MKEKDKLRILLKAFDEELMANGLTREEAMERTDFVLEKVNNEIDFIKKSNKITEKFK